METEFIIWVKGPVQSDVATFRAYTAILVAMNDDEYVKTIPDLVNVKYLSPSPILVPSSLADDVNTSPNNTDESNVIQNTVRVSKWTIGASVASIMGGFVSIMVYVRSRRSRQRRHLLAEETTPWVSPGENDNSVM
jgi:hypothetical protein